MAFDLETARVRVGLEPSDTSKDEMLKVAMNAALGEAQRYCNRNFFFVRESVEFIHFNSDIAQLSRYPIRRVFSVQADGNAVSPYGYHVHNNDGKIVFDYVPICHSLVVDYEGGYTQLPSELEIALWMIFDSMWASLDTSSSSMAVGSIKTISVPDVGSITYADASKASSSTDGTMPTMARSILDMFRMIVC